MKYRIVKRQGRWRIDHWSDNGAGDLIFRWSAWAQDWHHALVAVRELVSRV